jgi:iron complex outermembrane receptor protein
MIKPLSAAIASILLASTVSARAQAADTAGAATANAANAATAADAAAAAQDPTPAADDAAIAKKKPADVAKLGNVIVTGQRTPKAVEQIPGAINVVSEQEIAHTEAITEDATAVLARTVPGYSESSQAMSNTGENLRGRVALRLFDGVPQGSPLREGTRNGTFTDMGVVGRIEVINGPSASEGIGGAGGVINYISKSPTKEGLETTLVARYSSQFEDDSAGWKLGVTEAYKNGAFDFLGSIARIERGISYDGDGRRIGMNTSGSVSDSTADNLFLKAGYNFGAEGFQRLQASYSNFRIDGHGDYIQVLGCRPGTCDHPVTNTSERGHIFGSKAEFNDFEQFTLQYSNQAFLGGNLVVDYYRADQAMRYLPENGNDRQLERVPPVGQTACTNPPLPCGPRIFDQSEIDAKKSGLRSAWARTDIFGVEGLELKLGLDIVRDEAQQRLALTDRVWVPPLKYKSFAPWLQASWDLGPVTLSAGYRRQDDELNVDDYTTTFFRNSVFVKGGGVKYKKDLPNAGIIWRVGNGFSLFAAYGQGFTLPNIGIPLRNISTPGQSVDRIADLDAIVFTNREVGFNWRGEHGSLAVSTYRSKSPFGASLSVDPVSNDFVLTRAPVRIKGYEASGDWRFSPEFRISALYSHAEGVTNFYGPTPLYPAGDLVKPMGIADISPDKFGASATWAYVPEGEVTFGFTTLFDRNLHATDVGPTGTKYVFDEHTHGYTLFDLSANYDTGELGKFTVGVENVFNKQYILTWSQVDFFQNYWAGRGRMTSLTWTKTF